MTKLRYDRRNNGYEMEPWDRRRQQNQQRSQAYNKAINQESVFISGKYWNKDIGQVIEQDPRYVAWVLENQPRGTVAQQINRYLTRTQRHKSPLCVEESKPWLA